LTRAQYHAPKCQAHGFWTTVCGEAEDKRNEQLVHFTGLRSGIVEAIPLGAAASIQQWTSAQAAHWLCWISIGCGFSRLLPASSLYKSATKHHMVHMEHMVAMAARKLSRQIFDQVRPNYLKTMLPGLMVIL